MYFEHHRGYMFFLLCSFPFLLFLRLITIPAVLIHFFTIMLSSHYRSSPQPVRYHHCFSSRAHTSSTVKIRFGQQQVHLNTGGKIVFHDCERTHGGSSPGKYRPKHTVTEHLKEQPCLLLRTCSSNVMLDVYSVSEHRNTTLPAVRSVTQYTDFSRLFL